MPATVTQNKRTKFLGMYAIVADIQLDASYPTGGYALTPESFGLVSFDFVLPSSNKGYNAELDPATNKLKVYTTANTEVPNATSLATVKIRVLAMGT